MAKRLALMLILVVCLLPLEAETNQPYTIGIISLKSGLETLASLVQTSASQFAGTLYVSEKEQTLVEQLKFEAAQSVEAEKLHAAYEKHVPVQNPEQPVVTGSDTLQVSYTQVTYDENLAAAVQTGDTAAMDWLARRNGHIGLLILDTESFDSLLRVKVSSYLVGMNKTVLLLDELVQYANYPELAPTLDQALFSSSSNKRMSVVQFTELPVAASIIIDGQEHALVNKRVFLEPGKHGLQILAPGYKPVSEDVVLQGGRIHQLALQLTPITYPSVNLFSTSGTVDWIQEGKLVGQGSHLTLIDPTYPIVLTVLKDGFAKRIIHLPSASSEQMRVSLRPVFFSDPTILQEGQKDFYKRLRNTILLFGAYVGCSTFSGMVASDQNLWQVGLTATSAVALVSALAGAGNLARYAALAESSF